MHAALPLFGSLRLPSHAATWALGALFVAYALLSATSWWATGYLLSLVCAFALGSLGVSAKTVCVSLSLLMLPNIAMMAGARPEIGYDDFPFGLFGNPNYIGCALALTLAGAIAFRLWWYVPIALGGLWLTQSRTAIVAGGCVCLVGLYSRYKTTALILGLLAMTVAVSVSGGRESSMWMRVGIWQDTINHITFFGHGWGSFQDIYASWPVHRNIGTQRAAHAYNDFLEIVFETGIASILLWLVVIRCLEVAAPMRLVVLTYLVLSLSFFPLWVPVVGHFFAFALGHLSNQRSLSWRDGVLPKITT